MVEHPKSVNPSQVCQGMGHSVSIWLYEKEVIIQRVSYYK